MSESIANGQSVDVPVKAGDSLKLGYLGGSYSVRALAGLPVASAELATNSTTDQTLGPWARNIVARIVASAVGRVEFATGSPPVFAPAGIQHVRNGVLVELKGLGANAEFLPAGEDPTAPGALAITGSPATSIAEGGAYLFKPTISGGAAPYSLGTAAGRLPPGLRIDPIALAVTGWANQQGAFSNIVLQARDSAGNVANLAAFTVTVTAPSVDPGPSSAYGESDTLRVTSSSRVRVGAGRIVSLQNDGANTVDVTLYDDHTATGRVVYTGTIAASATVTLNERVVLGAYLALVGTSPAVIVTSDEA